ncbi:MAG: hypothetical protein HKM04_09495 [Legionellales bacterium]|nr:hypothetical protein [Legionellales bacterium]
MAMEPYNPLFGTPSPITPQNPFEFKIKNNRIQYPDIFFDIDALDLANLPPDLEYFGQFGIYRNYSDCLVIFRYKDQLLFHKRRSMMDHQVSFPWNTLYWLIEVLNSFHPDNKNIINLVSKKKTIDEHQLALISITGDEPGEEGFWLRDYDRIDPSSVIMGCRDIRYAFIEIYLSEFGIFEDHGLVILKKALTAYPEVTQGLTA